MKHLTTTLLLTLLVLGGCSGEAKFEEDCSLFGGGKLECSIRNIGTKQGSICVQVDMLKLEWKDFYVDIIAREPNRAISFNKLCTNLIEPLDMQTKTKQMTFFDINHDPFTPVDYCYNKSAEIWDDGCLISYFLVP